MGLQHFFGCRCSLFLARPPHLHLMLPTLKTFPSKVGVFRTAVCGCGSRERQKAPLFLRRRLLSDGPSKSGEGLSFGSPLALSTARLGQLFLIVSLSLSPFFKDGHPPDQGRSISLFPPSSRIRAGLCARAQLRGEGGGMCCQKDTSSSWSPPALANIPTTTTERLSFFCGRRRLG